jgi:hypothetical protein
VSGVSDPGIELNERAEIEADLEQQGLADEVSYDDVRATFGLFKRMRPFSEFGPQPSPAEGPEFRYTPEEGEEELFADVSDMWFPPED